MIVLIILNIILIVILIFLVFYIFRNKKDGTKNVQNKDVCDKNKRVKYKQNEIVNSEQVFVGRFITDEEYQQMMSNRRSDISILLEEVELEYEHLKELNNESKRNSER